MATSKPTIRAWTAEMSDKLNEGKSSGVPLRVGVQPATDGSRQQFKGGVRRYPLMTGNRGFGR